MLYIIEFICAVLFIGGIVLFGVFALSKVLAALVAIVLVVVFLRMEAAKGLLFIGAGFIACALACGAVTRVFM